MLACQLVATVPRALWVLGGRALVRPAFRLPRFTLAPVREILRVGVPAALSASINNLGLMTLTAVVTRLGEADLAAYGLGTRLDFLLMSFGYGFGAAVLTLVGMATGARRLDRARAFVTRAAAITVVLLALPRERARRDRDPLTPACRWALRARDSAASRRTSIHDAANHRCACSGATLPSERGEPNQ